MTTRQLRKFRQEVGQEIRKHRELIGLSQRAMSERLDVTYQMYQKYEYGITAMDIPRFTEICRVLGADAGKMINRVIGKTNGRKA